MPFIIYTLLRVGAIAVAYIVLFQVGMRGWLLASTSVLVGMMVSYIAFDKQRRRSAKQLQNWVTKRRVARGAPVDNFREFNDEEDAFLDAQALATEPGSMKAKKNPSSER